MNGGGVTSNSNDRVFLIYQLGEIKTIIDLLQRHMLCENYNVACSTPYIHGADRTCRSATSGGEGNQPFPFSHHSLLSACLSAPRDVVHLDNLDGQ